MRLPFMKREVDPFAETGTENSIWPQVAEFWQENSGLNIFSPRLSENVWVANRCIQLNSQQIAAMPLEFVSTAPGGGYEPAWLSNPDPVWFPNGISDAVFAVVRSIYGWGYAIIYVTSRYQTGFPQTWTVVEPSTVNITVENGRRRYQAGNDYLNADDVVQIDRNPGRIHGTSAIRSYAALAWGLVNAGNLASTQMAGGIPAAILKSKTRKLTATQAAELQTQWMAAVARRNGAPAVLPPEIDYEQLSFSPKDLLLLDAQQFNARALASAFGVPAFLLNLPMEGSLIYQNPQMLGEFWWRFELRNTAKRIGDALTAQMLPRGNAVVFRSDDTFAPLTEQTNADDAQTINASPADKPDAVVAPLRPIEVLA